MNFFTNSILQIIYYLFNDVLSQGWLAIVAFGSLAVYILGTIYAYAHYRQKYKFPLIFIIPVIRIFAILVRRACEVNEVLSYMFVILYSTGSTLLFLPSLEESVLLGIIGTIEIYIAMIIGAYINYDFLCYCDDVKKKDRSLVKGILYYFFPSLYLVMTAPENTKPKGPKSIIACLLAVIIFLQTVTTNSINANAQEYTKSYLETACQICNSSEQIIYNVVVTSWDDISNRNLYDYYYGVTSYDCEIIHLIKANEDFGFEYDVDGAAVYNDLTRVIAFVDFRDTDYGIDAPYVASICDIDNNYHTVVINYDWQKNNLDMDVYSSGVINMYTNSEEIGTPLLPSLNEVQYDVHFGDVDTDNAIMYLPKCVKKSEVISNVHEKIENNDQNNDSNDFLKWTTSDTVDLVAGSLAGTTTVVGVGTGLSLVLAGVTAVNPILGGTLWVCTGLVGGIAGYKFGASIGEKIYTGFIDNNVSETEKAIARKDLKKELAISTISISLGSCIVSYIQPKIASTIDTAFIVKIEATPELINHLENPVLKGNVVSGGHNETSFIEFCDSNGIKYELIDAKLPNGMKKYSYAVPDKTNGGFKNIRYKTVYDNINMTLNDYINYGTNLINQKALAEKWLTVPTGGVVIKDSYSIQWQYFCNDGNVSTFYPIN